MITMMKKDSLYEQLVQAIRTGKYPAEYRFPKEPDLAAELGVSRNTVRAALKRLEDEEFILRLKGKGTFVASGKKVPVCGSILVLADFTSDERYPYHYILPSIREEILRRGFGIETCELAQFSMFTAEQARAVIDQNHISAIILITSNFLGHEPIIPLTHQLRIPIVLAHGCIEDYAITGWAVVGCDFRAAWREALVHLAEQGHRRVITLAYQYEDRSVRLYSREKYLAMLRSLNLEDSEELILEAPIDRADGLFLKLENFLNRPGPRPTAVLAWSDFLVPGIYETLKKMNLRIPQDIAVMGFCGGMNVKFFTPPLSTVDLEYAECGRLSVEIAATASEWFDPSGSKSKAPPLIYCPYHLVKNESTAIRRFENRYRRTEKRKKEPENEVLLEK